MANYGSSSERCASCDKRCDRILKDNILTVTASNRFNLPSLNQSTKKITVQPIIIGNNSTKIKLFS